MPRYELCYILSAQVSDDQVPTVTEQIKKFVVDFGCTDINEQQLCKKKLAYPIKKTRNGFYVATQFDMDSKKINEFDAKIRSQTATIIRYLIANLDEHLNRVEKDKVAQASLPKRPTEEEGAEAKEGAETTKTTPAPAKEVKKEVAKEEVEVKEEKVEEPKVKVEMSESELDQKIEEALAENIK